MEKEFIPYEQALALKELGFHKPCFGVFDYCDILHFGKIYHYLDIKEPSYLAPTFSQAFRWFREKYDLHPSFTRYKSSSINREPNIFTHLYEIHIIDESADKMFHVGDFNSLEEAELECLKKLIEIVKDGKK